MLKGKKFDAFTLQSVLILKSATKPFNVLLACTHPLITEFALQYKYQKTNSSKRKTNSDNKNQ